MMDEIIKGPLGYTYDCARRVYHNAKIVLNYINKTGFEHPEREDVLKECRYFNNLSCIKSVVFYRSCKEEWIHSVRHAIQWMESSVFNTDNLTSDDFDGKMKRLCEHLRVHIPKVDEDILTGKSKLEFIKYASALCLKALWSLEEVEVGKVIQILVEMEWLRDRRKKLRL